MPPADLYLLRLQWLPYLTLEECQAAGAVDCEDFLARLQNQTMDLQVVPGLSPQKRYALYLALQGAELIPPVEALPLPQPTSPGVHEINHPGPEAPVLISGNSEITLAVLSTVLATTVAPFYLVLADTLGDTLDMALIYERFTPVKVSAALQTANLAARLKHRTLHLPGLAAGLAGPLAEATGWQIQVGPVCALELPLYFGDYWQPPKGGGPASYPVS